MHKHTLATLRTHLAEMHIGQVAQAQAIAASAEVDVVELLIELCADFTCSVAQLDTYASVELLLAALDSNTVQFEHLLSSMLECLEENDER